MTIKDIPGLSRLVLLLILACCLLSLGACSSARSLGVFPECGPDLGFSAEVPDSETLSQGLLSELKRLGIDPNKAPQAAPTGTANAVFNLEASAIDPDGPGGNPLTGIELRWTERLIGDYDQNGLVNASDLTPLGANWQAAVAYDEPSAHEGCEYWPAGDPDGTSEEAGNWRRARIDGNGNGLLEIADITPIAQHFKEQLSGYRIYRRGPQDAGWVLLPDPQDAASSLTVIRPEVQTGAPVLYEFIDTTPNYPGMYEYYVIAYAAGGSGVSAAEGEAQSNIAQATLILNTVDIYAPVWQGTIGIGNATASDDGTVSVEWGTAIDEEHPPAPPSPPVTYNLYYSAETPLDFGGAVKVENAVSPWTSPQLANGIEYYFAVRAQDSAAIPNEDPNTNELAVTITGGIVDDEPPVWTERYGPQTNDLYKGIRSLKVGDGKLQIDCADAIDELSPPVHYDLYYVSAADYLSVRGEDGYPIPEAQVIQDIPKVFTLYSENRHELLLNVFARDSANPPNIQKPFNDIAASPTDLKKVVLDPYLPGINSDCRGLGATTTQDIEKKRVYCLYSVGTITEKAKAYFAELNVETGDWEAQLILDDPQAEYGYGDLVLKLAPSGALWAKVRVFTGPFGVGFWRYYHRPAGGSWSEVEFHDPPDGFWNGILDQNEYPVFVSYYGTPEEGDNPLELHFYEPETETWRMEVACRYAAYPLAFWRPDGVMQLVTTQSGVSADEIPRYVAERSPDGDWAEVLSGFGKTTALPVTTPQWEARIAWAVMTTMRGDLELLTYGEDGYRFLPVEEFNQQLTEDRFDSDKEDPYINQVWDAGAHYHAMPYWLFSDGDYLESSYRAANELGNWNDPPHASLNEAYALFALGGRNRINPEVGQLIWLNPNTGQCAFVGVEDNLITKRQQVYMLTTFGAEASVFDPLTWE